MRSTIRVYGGPDRRALLPGRRGRPAGRPARAGRCRDLPGAHRGPAGGGRARRPAPDRHGPRDRRRRDAGRPGRDRRLAAMRSGFVALAGRPNVGKSTLVNAMVGRKVAIVSDKPQTTRRAIRGVVTAADRFQLVLTDLPGVQRPRDTLTARMQRRVETELAESDSALLVLNGEQGVGGPGDRFIAEALSASDVPVVIAVNKVDRLSRDQTGVALQTAADLGLDSEIFPISARTGGGVAALVEH